LGLSEGADFGAPGWLRLNFGCPRSTLDEALHRLERGCDAA
jgi:cystathionine beta-lyase